MFRDTEIWSSLKSLHNYKQGFPNHAAAAAGHQDTPPLCPCSPGICLENLLLPTPALGQPEANAAPKLSHLQFLLLHFAGLVMISQLFTQLFHLGRGDKRPDLGDFQAIQDKPEGVLLP